MTPIFLDLPRTRPLYLAQGKGWLVKLKGKALHISAAKSAPGTIPIRAISRVISASDVQWQPAALSACMKAGTTITFVDAYGNPQGYCHGVRRKETGLAGLLDELIDHPQWEDRFDRWLSSMHAQQIIRALRASGLRLAYGDYAAARSKLCQAAHNRCGRKVTNVLRQLEAGIHALVLEHLASALADPVYLGYPRPGFSFVQEFTKLMQWGAYDLLEGPEAFGLEPVDEPRLAARLIHGNRALLQARLVALLALFELWLRDWTLEVEA